MFKTIQFRKLAAMPLEVAVRKSVGSDVKTPGNDGAIMN